MASKTTLSDGETKRKHILSPDMSYNDLFKILDKSHMRNIMNDESDTTNDNNSVEKNFNSEFSKKLNFDKVLIFVNQLENWMKIICDKEGLQLAKQLKNNLLNQEKNQENFDDQIKIFKLYQELESCTSIQKEKIRQQDAKIHKLNGLIQDFLSRHGQGFLENSHNSRDDSGMSENDLELSADSKIPISVLESQIAELRQKTNEQRNIILNLEKKLLEDKVSRPSSHRHSSEQNY